MRSIALLTPFLAVLSSLCGTVIVTKRYPRASQITSAAPPCIGSTYAALLEHHRLRPSAGIPYTGVLRLQLSHFLATPLAFKSFLIGLIFSLCLAIWRSKYQPYDQPSQSDPD